MSLHSVLLTGVTGSVGAFVLDQLLANGNKVTAVVRSFKKSSNFLTQKYNSHIKFGTLKLVQIPDLTVPHIFDDLAKTVDAIIHIATPLAYSGDFQNLVIQPTAIIDESILWAAAKAPSVKRVIITGSIVSTLNLPNDLFNPITVSNKSYNTMTNEQGIKSPGNAYMYAKTAAEKKAWEFIEREKPDFDLVVLLAPSITGRCIQDGFVPDKKALGGMGGIYANVFDVDKVGFVFPYFMDVEDVAAIHLRSLDLEKVPGNERYLFHAGPLLSGPKLANKIREEYRDLRDRVPEGGDGDGLQDLKVSVDVARFEEVFGAEWRGWWESARGTVEDILKLEGSR